APVLRQIARYLPHHRSKNASKTHPKSSHDKFKTASNFFITLASLIGFICMTERNRKLPIGG
ncbi:hypothetical protein, partial [Bacteroides sp. An269]|uniref:hypothetical protein n=1 Tax=Bacteroides sp. An269 TaxID=1965613 RepID=UPI0019D2C9EB